MSLSRIRRSCCSLVAFIAAIGLLSSNSLFARQSKDPPAKSDPPKSSKDKDREADLCVIHIEVTAGEKNVPVDSASVYVRFKEDPKSKSDKLVEMDLKTSAEGKVRVPYVPKGRILIQVIAEHWKTYGKWFDLTEDGQVFKIHLDPPHHWY
ncbi:MAG TPA: hypothetical protein VMV61_15470 [Patescibacteria group bacterium]|nr:hypothetical protein [Patescibacteria group bacterium]